MDNNELVELLMSTFVAELDERMQALNHDLLALEKQPTFDERAGLLKTLFRTAHSLKGAARAVNVSLIETACHWLEEILTAVREGQLPFDRSLTALTFSAADAIQEAGNRLRARQELTGSPLEGLIPRLEAAVKQGGDHELQPPAAAFVSAEDLQPIAATSADAVAKALASSTPGTLATTVRVAAEKLDALLAQCGELLVARRRIESRSTDLQRIQESIAGWTAKWRSAEGSLRDLLKHGRSGEQNGTPRGVAELLAQSGERLRRWQHDLEHMGRDMALDRLMLGQAAGTLEDEVHRARLVPFGEGCQGLERAARDVARSTGKEVDFVLEGEDVEVDRSILEGLRDPLLHLVRNAVDHGIELPEKRVEAGKSARGRIMVTAALRGSHVEVVVADDGHGLDPAAIREHAQRKNIVAPTDDRDLTQLLFMPGFSTSPIITDVSGRGVGLDVVKSRLESLHGAVAVLSEAGQGTRFVLTVPLTLTTIPVLLVKAGGQTFAFASAHVKTIVRYRPAEVKQVGGREVLLLGEAPLPLATLVDVLGLADREPVAASEVALAVVIVAGDHQVAFVVDELLNEQTIVVKSLGTRIRRTPYVTGATLLPSGRIALLLNTANLAQMASRRLPSRAIAPASVTARPAKPRLLIVEDSLTTRSLMKSILEASGYEVAVAVDGQDAWERLQDQPVSLVVSDVEMPRMNGFALTEAIRGTKRFKDLPVVLITALEAEADKARGIEVGASAYLTKSAFDQSHLLETIAQLL